MDLAPGAEARESESCSYQLVDRGGVAGATVTLPHRRTVPVDAKGLEIVQLSLGRTGLYSVEVVDSQDEPPIG